MNHDEPIDPHHGDAQQSPGQAATEPLSGRNRMISIAAVILLLGAPVLYLVVHRTPSKSSQDVQSVSRDPSADIPAMEAAVRASPTVPNQLDLAAAYINQQQVPRAVPLLDAVLSADPKNAIAWNNYCVVRIRQQDLAAAADACNQALASDPKMQLAQNNLQWALDEQRKTRASLLEDAKIPASARTYDVELRDGLYHLHLGEYDDAITAFQAILVSHPKSNVAANNIGTAYMLKHNYSKAVPWFEKAIAFDQTSEISKNNLVWANEEIAKSRK